MAQIPPHSYLRFVSSQSLNTDNSAEVKRPLPAASYASQGSRAAPPGAHYPVPGLPGSALSHTHPQKDGYIQDAPASIP